MQGKVIDLDSTLALSAARASAELQISMADSIMLATSRMHEATLWTQDTDFEGVEGVKYISK